MSKRSEEARDIGKSKKRERIGVDAKRVENEA